MIYSDLHNIGFNVVYNDTVIATNLYSIYTPSLAILDFKPDSYIVDGYKLTPVLEHLRSVRDKLLDKCDWTVAPDSPLSQSEKIKWIQYRTALRDITEKNEGFTDDGLFKFPVAPSSPTSQLSITEKKKNAKNDIDFLAGEARAKIVSKGKYVEEEYRLAYEDAKNWKENNFQKELLPDSIAVWADIQGVEPKVSAEEIISLREKWFAAIRAIRAIRLTKKDEIEKSLASEYSDIIKQTELELNKLFK